MNVELSDSIVSFLCREDYLCEQAFSFAEAAMKVELYEYDCILLDLMLPGGNGLMCCENKKVHRLRRELSSCRQRIL